MYLDIRNEVLPMPGRRAAWPSPVRGYAYTPQQKWQQQTKDSAATGTHLSIGAQRYERRRQRQQQQQRNSDGVAVVASSDDKWQWQWQNYRQNTYQQQKQKQRQEQAFVKVQTPFNAVRQQHGARKKRYRRSLMTDQAFESIDLITRTHTKADDQMKAYENNINNTYNRKHKLENGNNFNVDKAKDSSDSNGDDSELLNVGKSEVADSFEVTQTTIPKAVELKLTNDNVIELVAQPAVVGNLVDTNERTKENELQESNKATVGETKEPKPLTDAKTRNHMTAESSALHKYQTLKLSNTQTASNYAAAALSQKALEIPLVFENITKARTVYDRNNSNNTPNGNRTARGGNVSAAKTLQINNVLNLNQNTNNDKEIAAATKTGVESAATQTSGSEIVAPAKTFAYDDDVSDGQQNNATLTTNAKVLSKAFMDKNNEVTNLTSDDEANAACGNDERNAYAASTSKCAGATTKLFEGDAIEDASTKPTPTASRPNIDLTTSDIHDIFGGDIDYVEGDTQREVRDSQAEFVKKVEGREEFIFKTATEINEISITTAATPGASVERMRTESVKVTAEEGAQTTAYKQVKTNLRVRKTNEPRYMKTLRKHFGRPIHAPVLPAAAAVQFLNVVINDDSQIDRPPVEEVQQEEIPQRNWQEEMHSNNTGISAVQSGKNIAVSDDFQIDGYATKKSENNVSENVHNADAHGTTTRHQEFEEANDSQINRHNGATDNTLSDSESDTNEAATDDNNNERDLVDSYDDVGYAARPQATPLPADTSSVIKIDKSELNEEKEWQRAAYDNVETRTETRVADEEWQSGRAAIESELEIKLNESQMQNEAAAMIEKHIAIVGVDADVEETTTTTTTKLMITADERQTMEINERASVARNEAGESDKQLAAETRDVQKSNVLVLGYGNKKEGEVADLLPLENVEDDSISAEEEAGVVTLRTTSVTGHTQMSDKQADKPDAAQTTEKPNSNNAKERESDEVEAQTHTTTIQLTHLSRNQKNPSTAVVDESNSEDELMLNDGLMPQHNNKQPINHNAPDNIIKRNRNFNSNSNAYAPTNDYQHFIAEPNADDIDIIKLEDTHSSEDEIYKTIEGAAREKPKYTYGKRKEIITSRPPRYPSHAENEILKGGVESNAANNYTDKLQPFPLKAPIVSESYDPPSKHILVNVTIATEGDSNSVYTLHVAVPIGGQSHDVQEVLTHERLKTRDHEEHAEEQPTISPYCIPEPPPPIPECPCKCADFLTVTEAADSVDYEEHFVPIEDLDETANFVHTDTATATTTAPNTTDNFIHPPFSPIAATTATMLTNTVNATEDSFISTTTTATFTNLLGVDAAHAASVDDHVVVGDGSKIACPDVMPILILEGDCF